MFSCAAGREEHCKQISLTCLGISFSVWATLGFPLLMACVISQSALLRFQVALLGNCLRQALVYTHFPGLCHSGSGSRVLHKGTDLVGPPFCAFPGPSSSGNQVLGEHTLPSLWGGRRGASYLLPHPSHSVSWVRSGHAISGVLCAFSGELIFGCDPPGRCQPSRIPGKLG